MLAEVLFGWSPAIWALAALATLAAAVVRGLTGFGFAMIVIAALVLFEAPVAVIPMVLLLDLAASVHLVPSLRHDINRPLLTPLVIGALLGVPLGVAVLTHLPVDAMRLTIGVAVLVAVVTLANGVRAPRLPGRGLSATVGAMAGFLSGSVGMPGPAVIVFFLASPLSVASVRASIAAFIFMTDVLTLALMLWSGLITEIVLLRAAVLAPAVVLGIVIGQRAFQRIDPEMVRHVALVVLALLAVGAIARVLVS